MSERADDPSADFKAKVSAAVLEYFDSEDIDELQR